MLFISGIAFWKCDKTMSSLSVKRANSFGQKILYYIEWKQLSYARQTGLLMFTCIYLNGCALSSLSFQYCSTNRLYRYFQICSKHVLLQWRLSIILLILKVLIVCFCKLFQFYYYIISILSYPYISVFLKHFLTEVKSFSSESTFWFDTICFFF